MNHRPGERANIIFISQFLSQIVKTCFHLGGGDKKIFDQKADFSKVSSKCGSLDNADHKAGIYSFFPLENTFDKALNV